jgi:hypothetical protein
MPDTVLIDAAGRRRANVTLPGIRNPPRHSTANRRALPACADDARQRARTRKPRPLSAGA